MFIRPASPRDHPFIPPLVEVAFGRHDEGLLVRELREAGDIALEYVATDRDELVGHVMMSRLIGPPGCLALAPVSVRPDRQGRGIGSTLVRIITELAEEDGWTAVFVVGNPRYYRRFGYEVEPAEDFDTPFSHEFTAVCIFDATEFGSLPREIIYPPAF